jgi:hypothetical protein
MVCTNCNNARPGGFTVIHYNEKSVETIRVDVCSTTCLIQWSYKFAQLQGMRIAFGVQQKISSVKNAITNLLKR